MFAKYDLDGDRILNEDEQVKMQRDLEGQAVRAYIIFSLLFRHHQYISDFCLFPYPYPKVYNKTV